jgi:UDP-N-acetylmuramate dehydrogenase
MKILEHIPLASYTTFKIGGNARYFVCVKNEVEINEAIEFAQDKNIPFFVLGGGSNLLISDNGFSGLVIKNEIKDILFEDKGDFNLVTAGAGEIWDELVAKTVERNLWGLENLSLIPGTVGASPVQNIGAYGTEAKDSIESVRVFDPKTKTFKIFSNKDCNFAYRNSVFKNSKHKHLIITSVVFKLSNIPKPNLSYKDLAQKFGVNSKPTISEIRNEVIKIRTGKFPDLTQFGTAGSFWKNPIICKAHFEGLKIKHPNIPCFSVDIKGEYVKVPLAWILDNVLKLKGYSVGKACLFERQPLVLVAEKDTTFKEIDSLAQNVKNKVFDATSIEIEREVESLV